MFQANILNSSWISESRIKHGKLYFFVIYLWIWKHKLQVSCVSKNKWVLDVLYWECLQLIYWNICATWTGVTTSFSGTVFFFSSSLPLTQCLVKIVILITLVFIHVNGNFNKEKNCNVVIETEQLYQPSVWI